MQQFVRGGCKCYKGKINKQDARSFVANLDENGETLFINVKQFSISFQLNL